MPCPYSSLPVGEGPEVRAAPTGLDTPLRSYSTYISVYHFLTD
jgi:hypothetical protein